MQRRTVVFLGMAAAILFDAIYLWAVAGSSSGGSYRFDRARLIVNNMGLYAGLVLLITTALTWRDLRRLRLWLSRNRTPEKQQWAAAFAGTGLSRLALRLLPFATALAGKATPPPSFHPAECRREILRLFWDSLVRVQFATVLAGLLAVAIAAWIQNHTPASNLGMVLPWEWTLAIFGVVLVLGALSWIVIGSAAETLLDTLGLAFEQRGALADSATPGLAEPLATLLEQNRQVFWEASTRIVESTDRLATIIEQWSDKDPAQNGVDSTELAEVKAAIESLEATLSGLPIRLQNQGPETEKSGSRSNRSESLGRDIRALLQQFE